MLAPGLHHQGEQPKVFTALANLNYVHFARFLPSSDGSTLWVITIYDGDPDPTSWTSSRVETSSRRSLLHRALPLPVHRYRASSSRSSGRTTTPWSTCGRPTPTDRDRHPGRASQPIIDRADVQGNV
jgi:hypothetical protein